ncbi:MAG: hypothetical protein JW734_02645 [Candidatus Omnitrophica bacterium]|nr:hypothetical protein [Candidatus Omnitrophota bacterium]
MKKTLIFVIGFLFCLHSTYPDREKVKPDFNTQMPALSLDSLFTPMQLYKLKFKEMEMTVDLPINSNLTLYGQDFTIPEIEITKNMVGITADDDELLTEHSIIFRLRDQNFFPGINGDSVAKDGNASIGEKPMVLHVVYRLNLSTKEIDGAIVVSFMDPAAINLPLVGPDNKEDYETALKAMIAEVAVALDNCDKDKKKDLLLILSNLEDLKELFDTCRDKPFKLAPQSP